MKKSLIVLVVFCFFASSAFGKGKIVHEVKNKGKTVEVYSNKKGIQSPQQSANDHFDFIDQVCSAERCQPNCKCTYHVVKNPKGSLVCLKDEQCPQKDPLYKNPWLWAGVLTGIGLATGLLIYFLVPKTHTTTFKGYK